MGVTGGVPDQLRALADLVEKAEPAPLGYRMWAYPAVNRDAVEVYLVRRFEDHSQFYDDGWHDCPPLGIMRPAVVVDGRLMFNGMFPEVAAMVRGLRRLTREADRHLAAFA